MLQPQDRGGALEMLTMFTVSDFKFLGVSAIMSAIQVTETTIESEMTLTIG